MILIAGAGLAGLSTAFHLKDREYRIIERDARPGGLCKTETVNGLKFDYGGHLLHLRGEQTRVLVNDLIGDKIKNYKRKSAIFSNNMFTPYPFQANTYGLPAEVIGECLTGFVEALLKSGNKKQEGLNFYDFILHSFGEGFAKHFFFPFNEKFFKTDLRNITDEWVSWSIPRPDYKEVINGALGVLDSDFGYNIEFLYPDDGIEELPKALAERLSYPVETDTSIIEVIPSEKKAILSSGEEVKYEKLVSTMPLDYLTGMLSGAPEEITEASKNLNIMSVVCLNPWGLRPADI